MSFVYLDMYTCITDLISAGYLQSIALSATGTFTFLLSIVKQRKQDYFKMSCTYC